MKTLSIHLAVAIAIVLLASDTAQAYIDPGTGSYVFQILIAGILGALFAVKVFWRKITTFMKGLFHRSESPGEK